MPPFAEASSRFEHCGNYTVNGCCRKPASRTPSPEPSTDDITSWWLLQAAKELQWMKESPDNHGLHRFPPACYQLVKSLPGNDVCMDCGSRSAEWSTTSYGALLCLQCSARHRSLGVEISKVRSLTLDHWSHEQVLSMLEGGNQQLHSFFNRHFLTCGSVRQTFCASAEPLQIHRYRTKAARFYREQLRLHAARVASASVYQGREASRKQASEIENPSTTSACQTHDETLEATQLK